MSKEKEGSIISPKIDKLVVRVVEDEEDDMLEELLRKKGERDNAPAPADQNE